MSDSKFHYKDGAAYPRVTSVLSKWFDPEPVAATYVAQTVVELTDLIRDGEKYVRTEYIWNGSRFEPAVIEKNPLDLLGNQKWLTGAYWAKKQGTLDRGTLGNIFIDEQASGTGCGVHEIPEWVDLRFEEGKMLDGATVPTPWKCDRDDLIDRCSAVVKFFEDVKPDIRASQIMVWSDGPRYSGTPDAIGSFLGQGRVLEYKMGEYAWSHLLQVVAYAMTDTLKDLVPTLVYFKRDGYTVWEVTDVEVCYAAFLRSLDDFNLCEGKKPWQKLRAGKLSEDDYPFMRNHK